MITTWHSPYLAQLDCLPFSQLEHLFALSQSPDWPNAAGLNRLSNQFSATQQALPRFVCQSQLQPDGEYYEQIIFNHGHIPTRPDNWHDLFNGLIWLQFPRVKKLLNQQHVQDIDQYGVSPRTLRRNNLTHFDECGVVLAVEEGHEFLLDALAQHQWHRVFVEHRAAWGQTIHPCVFGHANLEMLLQPFIGLTGKWLGVSVAPGFAALPLKQQRSVLDQKVAQLIERDDVLARHHALLPVPLLGIPGYCAANHSSDFYQNKDYFRPKSPVKSR